MFRVQGARFSSWGLGFKVQGSGLKVKGLRLKGFKLYFTAWGQGVGFREL